MKNTPKQILTASALIAGLVGLSSVAQAAPVTWDGSDVRIGDYHTQAPEFYTSAEGATSINTLEVGFGSNGNGTLNITGGTLTSNSLYVGMHNDAVGTVNINGGALVLNQAGYWIGNSTGAGSKISLSSGSVTANGNGASFWMGGTANGTAEIEISGGSWNGGKLLMNNGGTADVSVIGSAATSIFFRDSLFGNGTNNFNFTASADGVTQADFNAIIFDGNGTQNLLIDISSYDATTYGDSLTIIDSNWGGTFSTSVFDSITIIGGTGDLTATAYNNDFGTTITLENITVVPEPSTYALIGGCFALSAVMLRRRQR